MKYSFPESTSIESIFYIDESNISITWKSGKTYKYSISDVENFTNTLTAIMNSKQSIGKFINMQIQENALQLAS